MLVTHPADLKAQSDANGCAALRVPTAQIRGQPTSLAYVSSHVVPRPQQKWDS